MAKSSWSYKTAGEMTEALAARKVSALELAEEAIARIERCDERINAVCVRDFSRALDAAAPPTRRWRAATAGHCLASR